MQFTITTPRQELPMRFRAPEVNRLLACDDSVNESNVASARVTSNSLLGGDASEVPAQGDIDLNRSIGPRPGGNSTVIYQSSVRDRAVPDNFTCTRCKRSGLPASFSVSLKGRRHYCNQCIECRAASSLKNASKRPDGPFHGVSPLEQRATAQSYLKKYFKPWEKKSSFLRPPKEVVDKMIVNVTAQFEANHRDKRVRVQKTFSGMKKASRNLRNRLKPHEAIFEMLEKDEERVFAGICEQYEKFAGPWISIADRLDKRCE